MHLLTNIEAKIYQMV